MWHDLGARLESSYKDGRPQTDVAKGGRGSTDTRGFWAEEMKRLPAEHGDQSIKDQPQTVWGEEERGEKILW